MKKIVFSIILTLFATKMGAQESQTGYNFLRLPVSAHAAALGGDNITFNSWGERMQFLDEMGFQTVERVDIQQPTTDNIQADIDAFTLKVTQNVNPFPVDGLVITYDDTQFASTGSVTGHHATRAGFAFKWQDEHAATRCH